MAPKKALFAIVFNINQSFFGCFNSSSNSISVLPDSGLWIEILTYSPSIYSIVQEDHSLILLSNPYKTSWKDLSRPYLQRSITVLAVELEKVNYVFPFFCLFVCLIKLLVYLIFKTHQLNQ